MLSEDRSRLTYANVVAQPPPLLLFSAAELWSASTWLEQIPSDGTATPR